MSVASGRRPGGAAEPMSIYRRYHTGKSTSVRRRAAAARIADRLPGEAPSCTHDSARRGEREPEDAVGHEVRPLVDDEVAAAGDDL